MAGSEDSMDDMIDDDDLFDCVQEQGEEVAYQDWDSGGPGAGAGRVSVYHFEGRYYGFHDAEVEGPFKTKREAVAQLGVNDVNDATVEIWDKERGVTWSRRSKCED